MRRAGVIPPRSVDAAVSIGYPRVDGAATLSPRLVSGSELVIITDKNNGLTTPTEPEAIREPPSRQVRQVRHFFFSFAS